MTDFLDMAELAAAGFARLGAGVRISRGAQFFGRERIEIGPHTRIDTGCVLSAGPDGIRIGRNVHLSALVTVLGRGRVEIGDFCTVSVRCSIFSSNDDYSGRTMTNPTVPPICRNADDGPVRLGAHAILGTGCVVLPHVVIGESASIGALSLVKAAIPAFAIAAGCPARLIGERRREHRELAARFLAAE